MPADRDTYFTPEELRINAECQAREAAYRAVPRPSPLKPPAFDPPPGTRWAFSSSPVRHWHLVPHYYG